MSNRKRTFILRGPSTTWGNVATVSPLADMQAFQEEMRKVVGYRGVKEKGELLQDLVEREKGHFRHGQTVSTRLR